MRELDGEAVLLDVETGRYFGLNASGVRIWALLGEGEPLDRIVGLLAAEYGSPTATLRADIEELCAALEREGLIDRVG